MKFVLLPHQEDAIKFIKSRENDAYISGGFLGMTMGLGKTFTMLSTIMNDIPVAIPDVVDPNVEYMRCGHVLVKNMKMCPCCSNLSENRDFLNLVVAPKTALITWEEEIKKFYPSLKYFIFTKEKNANIDKITIDDLKQYSLILTNYEYLRGVAKRLDVYSYICKKSKTGSIIGANSPNDPIFSPSSGEGLLYSIKWNRIVADESHNFANNKTALFASMISLCSYKKWCLSGTPIRNSKDDLYSQYKFLGYKDNGFDYDMFRSQNLNMYIHYIDYKKANIVLPELFFNRVNCSLTGKQAEIYKYYINQVRETYGNFIIGTKKFSDVLVMFLRLRQVCVSPYTIIKNPLEETEEYECSQKQLDSSLMGLSTWLHDKSSESGMKSSKILKTIDIVSKVPAGEKIVIFTMFRKVMTLLEEAILIQYPNKNIIKIDGSIVKANREKAISNFKNDVNSDILIISYKIGSESLNLTEANHIILVEPWWCPAVIEQAKARVQRMGQTKKLYVYELVIDEIEGMDRINLTIEQQIVSMCDKKTKEAIQFLSNKTITHPTLNSLNADQIGKLIGVEQLKPNAPVFYNLGHNEGHFLFNDSN